MKNSKTRAVTVSCSVAMLAALGLVGVGRAEPIGKVSQPLIVGDPVSVERQRTLGLVTVCTPGGCCSGTLLNRFWVLTADHCVSTDGNIGGPAESFANLDITATWSGGTINPTRYVRYWDSNGLDVALIGLGATNLPRVDLKLIYHNEVDTSMTLTKFGRGICAYATGSGPTAQPAQGNCGYRSARFTPGSSSATSIVLPRNAAGQVGFGGDSGGPDYVTGDDDTFVSIAGVSSTCQPTAYVPGMPRNGWTWVTGVSGCTSAALYTIRSDILRVIAPPKVANRLLDGPLYPVEPDQADRLKQRYAKPGDQFTGPATQAPAQQLAQRAEPAIVMHKKPRISVPGQGSLALDWCREWATNCGQPAADAFCREASPERPHASRFTMAPKAGPTAIISSRQICGDPACDGFDQITCAREPGAR